MKDTDTQSDDSSNYILNREYFSECFDQTADTTPNPKKYLLAITFAVIAGVMFATETEAYMAWFLICLSAVELLSIRYKRAWWIARQMLSRAAGSKVTIRIDDEGIFTNSSHHQLAMLWDEINAIKSTEKGFVISHDSGNCYVSRSGLDESALTRLSARSNTQNKAHTH